MGGKTLQQETACRGQMFLNVTELVYTDFAIFCRLESAGYVK